MKPETEAKAIIALIISLIAFGVGSGAGIVMGLNQNDIPNATHITKNQDMPTVPSTKNVNIQPQNTDNSDDTNSEYTYVDNSGNGNSNNGNSDNSSSDTGNEDTNNPEDPNQDSKTSN